MKLLKYVKVQPGIGIVMSSKDKEELTAYSDSDKAACHMSRKSPTILYKIWNLGNLKTNYCSSIISSSKV